MTNVFHLVSPVYDLDTYISKVNIFAKQAKLNRIPYSFPRSAYPTCRSMIRTPYLVASSFAFFKRFSSDPGLKVRHLRKPGQS